VLHTLVTVMTLLLMLGRASQALAGSATWNSSVETGDWNTAANWTPNVVPNGPADTATFASPFSTDIGCSENTEVEGITVDQNASSFTVATGDRTRLTSVGQALPISPDLL
jgi:hypothetical protein